MVVELVFVGLCDPVKSGGSGISTAIGALVVIVHKKEIGHRDNTTTVLNPHQRPGHRGPF
jgi:hypothetical protein